MPYIITPGIQTTFESYAVATFGEAVSAARTELGDHGATGPDDPAVVATLDLPEAGGMLGPLPDGFVVGVLWVDWKELHALAGLSGIPRDYTSAEILDAYNQQ